MVMIFTRSEKEVSPDKNAVITLVTGKNSGYVSGAVALGQSLKQIGSKMTRIVMVTPEVDEGSRESMLRVFDRVVEVEPVYCNHKMDPSITPDRFDLSGANYQAGIKRWQSTCTKFRAWEFVEYDRVVFMDSDTLVVNPIDDVLYEFGEAEFLAAPEAFPPDNFNSGFMVITPSKETFSRLLEINEEVGSAEGGDQGVFNNGFCPNWFYADSTDKKCGRIPWIFNVEAANFPEYNTLRQMSGLRLPCVVHFVSDGKPWKVLATDYVGQFAEETKQKLFKQALPHLMWRQAYFRGSGDNPPRQSVFDELTKPEEFKARQLAAAEEEKSNNANNELPISTSKQKTSKKKKSSTEPSTISKKKKSTKKKKNVKKKSTKKKKKKKVVNDDDDEL
eukprot:CAMPEP_0182427704 /NCGR_PEP_ID=MMETSP1167-20130531/18999_1 /TAXON_ID=2988 /ORGANISM="Mallomonas Sp, Strain CCMP3275" /LENGTH=389 /DNA_ID=CAMNT_0024610135 /DNA_START=100 /DNA_END=1269 /DNA_ORIENTATION=+